MKKIIPMISVGLDLGNSKVSCIVCDINSQGDIKPLSFVSRPSKGIKKNVIADTSELKNDISEIISQVSKESQTEIASIRLNVSVVSSTTNYINSEIFLNNEKISDLHLKKLINESNILDSID